MSKKIWVVLKCENRLSFHLTFLIVGLLITSSLFSVNCAASIENNLAISERFINYWIKGQFAEAASLLVEKEGFNAIEELKLNQEKFNAVV